MVKKLISIVEENTDIYSMPEVPRFKDYLTKKGVVDRLSFYTAIDEFHDYLAHHKLSVSPSMKSIKDLFGQDA